MSLIHDSSVSSSLSCVYRGVSYGEGEKICITRQHAQLCYNAGAPGHAKMVWGDSARNEGAEDNDAECQGSSATETHPGPDAPVIEALAGYCTYGERPFSQGARICIAAQSTQRCFDAAGPGARGLVWGDSQRTTGSSDRDDSCPAEP